MLSFVPMTLEQVVAEAREWPAEQIGELVARLTEELPFPNPGLEALWKDEARRRLAELDEGMAQPVDGEAVAARVRRIVGR